MNRGSATITVQPSSGAGGLEAARAVAARRSGTKLAPISGSNHLAFSAISRASTLGDVVGSSGGQLKYYKRPNVASAIESLPGQMSLGASLSELEAQASASASDASYHAQLSHEEASHDIMYHQDAFGSHRSIAIQTAYRESAAQTDPYTPEYVLPPPGGLGGLRVGASPQVLLLADFKIGGPPGKALPAGASELAALELARQRSQIEDSMPPTTDEASLAVRKRLMKSLELAAMAVKSKAIDAGGAARLELVEARLRAREAEREFVSEQRLGEVRRRVEEAQALFLATAERKSTASLRSLTKRRDREEHFVDALTGTGRFAGLAAAGSKGKKTTKDVIGDYSNYGSAIYAPNAREGSFPDKLRTAVNLEIQQKEVPALSPTSFSATFATSIKKTVSNAASTTSFFAFMTSSSSVASLPHAAAGGDAVSVSSGSTAVASSSSSVAASSSSPSAAATSASSPPSSFSIRGSLHTSTARKEAALSAHLESITAAIAKARAGGEEGSLSDSPPKVVPAWRQPKVTMQRPPTPTFDGIEDAAADDKDVSRAVLLIQTLLRGRAIQSVMLNGKGRSIELIQEMREPAIEAGGFSSSAFIAVEEREAILDCIAAPLVQKFSKEDAAAYQARMQTFAKEQASLRAAEAQEEVDYANEEERKRLLAEETAAAAADAALQQEILSVFLDPILHNVASRIEHEAAEAAARLEQEKAAAAAVAAAATAAAAAAAAVAAAATAAADAEAKAAEVEAAILAAASASSGAPDVGVEGNDDSKLTEDQIIKATLEKAIRKIVSDVEGVMENDASPSFPCTADVVAAPESKDSVIPVSSSEALQEAPKEASNSSALGTSSTDEAPTDGSKVPTDGQNSAEEQASEGATASAPESSEGVENLPSASEASSSADNLGGGSAASSSSDATEGGSASGEEAVSPVEAASQEAEAVPVDAAAESDVKGEEGTDEADAAAV